MKKTKKLDETNPGPIIIQIQQGGHSTVLSDEMPGKLPLNILCVCIFSKWLIFLANELYNSLHLLKVCLQKNTETTLTEICIPISRDNDLKTF